MAKIEQFKCDGCGKLRGEDTNHWWVVELFTDGTGFHVAPRGRFDESAIVGRVFDFCGQQCALAFISAQMQGGKG